VDGKNPETPAWYFYYVRWLTRCDVVTNTPVFVDPENTFDRWRDTVEWADDKTVPWEKSDQSFWWTRNTRLCALNTSDPAMVNWQPTAWTLMILRTKGWRDLYIDLWTGDIDFDHFQVSVNNGEWQALPKENTYMGFRTSSGHMGPLWGPKRFAMNRRTENTYVIRAQVARRDGSFGPVSFVKVSNP
jgi:hypothetical protein